MAQLDLTLSVHTLAGEPTRLTQYQGKVLLIVNTASKCGFTPQYAGLEALWQRHRDAGLVVLGFPCDQFAHQEPGSSEEIAEFCQLNYGVSFPLFAKIEVNGAGTHPLFQQLKAGAPGLLGSQTIKWNFTKFLVGRDGQIARRYGSATKPEALEDEVLRLLAEHS
ncbi:MAG: glutathione peroxidase [Deltaproteobacteria bacterium]|nr:glutathione peroxidase [Deltaproteobacteria bacterium]